MEYDRNTTIVLQNDLYTLCTRLLRGRVAVVMDLDGRWRARD